MFGSDNKDRKKQAGITLIANNCEVVGDVHFSDELQVNGFVTGNIIADQGSNAKVSVTEKGRVKGEIRVPSVIINGEVSGDIYSDKHIELSAKARVKGSVYYNLIEMVMGARVDGSLLHMSEEDQAQSASASEEDADIKPQKIMAVSDNVG